MGWRGCWSESLAQGYGGSVGATASANVIWEKVGPLDAAKTLIAKRQTESHLQKKLPEQFRGGVTFGDLVKDALAHSREQNGERSTHELKLKFGHILPNFDKRPASGITKQEIQNWLATKAEEREWSPATRNRYRAAFSLVFSVGMDNEKISANPMSKIERKTEKNGRTRLLDPDEELAIRAVLKRDFRLHEYAFLISLHTGVRD